MANSMSDQGMPDDLYGEDYAEPKEAPETVDEEREEEMGSKAVVPVKVLMGKHQSPIKEGDEVVVKVTGVHGDDAEIKYSETKPSDIGGGKKESKKEMSADDEIDSMSDSGGSMY